MNKKLDTNSIGHPDERGGELRKKREPSPILKLTKKLSFQAKNSVLKTFYG